MGYGIFLTNSAYNEIYSNSIDNNVNQAYDDGSLSWGNTWDNGYPGGGNHWSDYTGVDNYNGIDQNIAGSDYIGDTPYSQIDGGINQDNYPILYDPFDNVAPTSNITPISPYWISSSPLTIVTNASDNINVGNVSLWFRYSEDNITWNAWEILNTDYMSPWSWEFYFINVGYYEFFSIASDISGNVEPMKNFAESTCYFNMPGLIAISPIRINSNSDFDFSHGVTSGNGTESNPWVIENFIIDGTGYGYCIYIGNTTDYFIAQNCHLSKASGNTSLDPPYGNDGLILRNVTNGRLNNITSTQNEWDGIHIYYSNNIIVENITAVDNPGNDILLEDSSNNFIFSNNLSTNQNSGISLITSNNNIIFNNSIEGYNSGGIDLWSYSNNNTIYDNKFTGTELSIWDSSNNSIFNNVFASGSWLPYFSIGLYSSDNNSIMNNVCNDTSTYLIFMRNSDNNEVVNNSISQSEIGIYIEYSKGNEVNYNSISDIIGYGISLEFSTSQIITNNTMINCSIMIEGDVDHWDSHTIAESNKIDDKPVLYYSQQAELDVPVGAGEIILGNCDYINITNHEFSNSRLAILVGHSRNISITNSSFSNITGYGGIILSGNQTSYCNIANNTMHDNEVSIFMKKVNYNSIKFNTLHSNRDSIIMDGCHNNTISHNIIDNNSRGIKQYGESNYNLVFRNYILNNSDGLDFWNSQYNNVTQNIFAYNRVGVWMVDINSKFNLLYHNAFLNNTEHVNTWGGNYWYNDYPIGGNYWSDYVGWDNYSGIGQDVTGSDGIGDKHYTVYSWITDPYPLMWIPDWEAPVSSLEQITPYWRNSQILIAASAVDQGYSGVNNVSLWYRHSTDNISWGDWTLYETDLSSPWSWEFIASEDGYYEFYSISQDNASNSELPPNSPDACLGFDTTSPISDAGLDQVAQIGEVVNFSSSGCSDNLLILNYSWSFEYNSSTYILYEESPEFIFWTSGNYTITLNVTDAAGNWATDDMTVLVEPKESQIIGDAGYLWIVIILIVFGVLGTLFILYKKSNKPGGKTAEEPTLETEKCPDCGFEIETGSPCPFCVEGDTLEPMLEEPKP